MKKEDSLNEKFLKQYKTSEEFRSFGPVIVPKRSQLSNGIGNLRVSLYAKGMSNSDMGKQVSFKRIYGHRFFSQNQFL